MQAKKSVFRPIALAVSALISSGAFAQATVTTYTLNGNQLVYVPLGQYALDVSDSNSMTQSTLGSGELSLSRTSGGSTYRTDVTSQGISTSSLSGSYGGTLAVSGIVDFSNATVQGLTGSFNPAEVTSSLIGGTMGGTQSTPSFDPSGFSVDLVNGEAALGATTTTTLRTTGLATLNSVAVTGATTTRDIINTGDIITANLRTSDRATLASADIIRNATVGGTLAVTGATTTNGITNTGNIDTTTLRTNGLATLNSAAITNNATVGGTLAVTGATTTHGIENTGLLKNTGIFLATSAPQVQGQPNTGIQIDSSQAMMGTNDGTNITALRMGMSDGVSGPAQLLGNLVVTSAFGAGLDGTSETVGANGGNLTVMGTTTLNGATTVNNTLNVNGATTVVGATSITGATTVVGTTNINTTGTAATSIGNSAAPVAVTGSTASFTGGTSNLTLNNNGATFSNAGSPAKVTGIANGTGDFDAVNVRQFSSAVAGVAAAANIPGVDTNKTASVGVGMGSYMNSQALAFGGSYRFSDNGVLRASLATGLNTGGSKTSFGIGAGWSW